MMNLHSPSWSSGKLPRSGGMGLLDFWRPPGPPKDICFVSEVYGRKIEGGGLEGSEELLMGEDCKMRRHCGIWEAPWLPPLS